MLKGLIFITAPLTALVLLAGCNNAGTPAASNVFAGNWNANVTLEIPDGTSLSSPAYPVNIAFDGKITSSGSTSSGTVQGMIQNDGTTNFSISGSVSDGSLINVALSGKLGLSGATASGKLSAVLTSNTSTNTVTVPANVTLTRR